MFDSSLEARFAGFREPIGRFRPRRLSSVLRTLRDASVVMSPDTPESEFLNKPDLPSGDLPCDVIDVAADELSEAETDRRGFLRRKSRGTVRVLPRNDVAIPDQELTAILQAAPYRGRMSDLSMSGVAFVLSEPLSELATVWVRLENDHRDFAVTCSAHIIRVVQTDTGEWKIMCRFDRFLSQDDVWQLGYEVC